MGNFKPKYHVTNKILNHLTEIAVTRQVIDQARLVPKWEIALRKEALIHSVHSSTHIEGNNLTLEEVSQLALGREISAIRKDKQEVLNYLNILSNLEDYTEIKKISSNLVLDIHKKLVQGTLKHATDEGRFRNRQVVIGHRDNKGKAVITFKPPPSSKVSDLIESFLSWLNSVNTAKINPVLLSGITHYEMVRIHPFIDGNGRTARVLAALILLRKGFDTKRFFALDDFYDSDRQSYYEALKSVNPKTIDTTEWLEYFCEGVSYSVNKVKEKVMILSRDKRVTGSLDQVSLNKRQMQIVEKISQSGKITSKQMQTMFEVSAQAVHKEIKKLLALKVVKLVGKGRNSHYELM